MQAEQQAVLEWLGLTTLQARLLLLVMAQEETTSAALRAETGTSAQSVSAAVDGLIRLRLLERRTEIRPQLLFLHAGADQTLTDLLQAARESEQLRESACAGFVEAFELAVRRRAERRAPRGAAAAELPGDRGGTSHDEVLSAVHLGLGTAGRSLLGCPARLLVTDTGSDFSASRLAGQQAFGSEVRTTTEGLPALLVLDGRRVGVHGSSPYGRGRGWSEDERQVRAAQELFGLWWERAGPGVVKPYPPRQPEPEWDVEEWDPADL